MRRHSFFPPLLEALEPRVLLSGGSPIPGDANADGLVDGADFTIFKANLGEQGGWSEGDFNGDGLVDAVDFTILKAYFGSRLGGEWGPYLPGAEVSWRIEPSADGPLLVVLGTDGDDAITVSKSGATTIVITGGQTHLVEDYLAGVELYGFAGDDLLVSISGRGETIWGGAGFDSFWADSLDSILDADALEVTGTAVHVITEFFQPTSEPAQYVSLELVGQDIVDPTAAVAYADFSGRPLFVDGPEYDDVIQGNIGDCYFLAALSSLADSDPWVVEQMIAPLGDGTYAVRFHRDGGEVYVRADAELPAYYGTLPAYAKLTGDGELWVALAEKAYAQFRTGENSYASLASGWMNVVYTEVTGLAADKAFTSIMSLEALAGYISDSLQNGSAVSAGTYGSTVTPIVKSHAYVVMSIADVGGQWYVTVYNVWGQDGREWDDNYDDGLVTISLEMFKQNFSAVCVSSA